MDIAFRIPIPKDCSADIDTMTAKKLGVMVRIILEQTCTREIPPLYMSKTIC